MPTQFTLTVILRVSLPDIVENEQSPHSNMCVTLPDIRSPKLVLRGCHLCQFSFQFEETNLFSESFVEGIQRILLRDPGLGVTLVAGVYPIDLTTVLHMQTLNCKDLDAHEPDLTSVTRTPWLGYKSPGSDAVGSVIPVHVISSVRAARLRGLE